MIKSYKSGETPQAGGGSYPLARKSQGPGPVMGHRSAPEDHQGLGWRADTSRASREEQYRTQHQDHDSGAAWAQERFESLHEERRIDSGNFPASKDF
jgi:hypothetical protein